MYLHLPFLALVVMQGGRRGAQNVSVLQAQKIEGNQAKQ